MLFIFHLILETHTQYQQRARLRRWTCQILIELIDSLLVSAHTSNTVTCHITFQPTADHVWGGGPIGPHMRGWSYKTTMKLKIPLTLWCLSCPKVLAQSMTILCCLREPITMLWTKNAWGHSPGSRLIPTDVSPF